MRTGDCDQSDSAYMRSKKEKEKIKSASTISETKTKTWDLNYNSKKNYKESRNQPNKECIRPCWRKFNSIEEHKGKPGKWIYTVLVEEKI